MHNLCLVLIVVVTQFFSTKLLLFLINLYFKPTTAEYFRTEVFLLLLILKYLFVYMYMYGCIYVLYMASCK